jgi:hypothetical protein
MMREEITQIKLLGVEMFMKHKCLQHIKKNIGYCGSDVQISNGIVVHCPEAIKYLDKIIFGVK